MDRKLPAKVASHITSPEQRGKKRPEPFIMPERSISAQSPHPSKLPNLIRGARNYAKGNQSDPFAYARAAAHIKSGVASMIVDDKTGRASDGYYDGKLSLEGKTFTRPNGQTENYNVETVVDMKAA